MGIQKKEIAYLWRLELMNIWNFFRSILDFLAVINYSDCTSYICRAIRTLKLRWRIKGKKNMLMTCLNKHLSSKLVDLRLKRKRTTNCRHYWGNYQGSRIPLRAADMKYRLREEDEKFKKIQIFVFCFPFFVFIFSLSSVLDFQIFVIFFKTVREVVLEVFDQIWFHLLYCVDYVLQQTSPQNGIAKNISSWVDSLCQLNLSTALNVPSIIRPSTSHLFIAWFSAVFSICTAFW